MSSSPPRKSAHVAPSGPASGTGPLRIGAYHLPTDSEASTSWSDIVAIIEGGDLGDLNRHPKCEEEYKEWREPIKEKYGGLEDYIRQVRLGWEEPTGEETKVAGQEYFHAEWIDDADEQRRSKCIPNDWPYSIPGDCGHFCVWSIAPMLDETLFQSPDTPFEPEQRRAIYEAVAYDGIRGRTGCEMKDGKGRGNVVGMRTIQALYSKEEVKTQTSHPREAAGDTTVNDSTHSTGRVHQETTQELARRAQLWAGRECSAYVAKRWPEDQWETAWFCNPPHLRTVPGLSHFHVMVRSKQ